jgi:hypothetical protein
MRRRDNLAHAYAQSRIMQIAKNEWNEKKYINYIFKKLHKIYNNQESENEIIQKQKKSIDILLEIINDSQRLKNYENNIIKQIVLLKKTLEQK